MINVKQKNYENDANWHRFGGAFIVNFLLTSFKLFLLLSSQTLLAPLKVVSVHLKRSQTCNETFNESLLMLRINIQELQSLSIVSWF